MAAAVGRVAPTGHAFAHTIAPTRPVAPLPLEIHSFGERLVKEQWRPFLLLDAELSQILWARDDFLDHVRVVRCVSLLTDCADVSLAWASVRQSGHLAGATSHLVGSQTLDWEVTATYNGSARLS